MAEVDGQLGRVRPRDQVGRPHQVQELGVVDPPASPYHLVAHERYVRRRAAAPDDPQLEEQARDLTQPARRVTDSLVVSHASTLSAIDIGYRYQSPRPLPTNTVER
jgi:hypothetical protein